MTIEALTQKLHLTLNAMQTAVCDELLQHTDNLMVLSPTGSGKTLAYLLPLTQLLDAQSNQVQAVVVAAIGHSAQRHGLRIARYGLLWRARNDGRTPQVA